MSGNFPAEARPFERSGLSSYLGTDARIVFVLFLMALTVRLFHIGTLSLWIDEAASLTFARAPWQYLWGPLAAVETNPPGYYSILKLWISAFGMSDASSRIPNAIAGTLCIIPVYAIALRHHGRSAAVIATVFLVVSAIQVQYSQEVRSFSLTMLLFVLGLMAAGRIVSDAETGKRRIWGLALLTLCCGALPHMHITGFIVIMVIFVYLMTLLWLKGLVTLPVLRDLSLAALFITVLSAPVIYWTILILADGASPVSWIQRPTLERAIGIYNSAFGHRFITNSVPSALGFLPWTLGLRDLANITLALVCILSCVQAFRRRQQHVIALSVAFAFLVTSFFLISQFKPILIDRVVLFGLPIVFLIAAYGLASLPWKKLVMASVVLLFGFQVLNLAQYFRTFEKEAWREMISSARELHMPGAAVVIVTGGAFVPVLIEKYWDGPVPADVFILYSDPNNGALEDALLTLQPMVHRIEQGELCETLADFTKLLLLHRTTSLVGKLDRVERDLEATGGRLLESVTFPGVEMQSWSALNCDPEHG